VLAPLSGAKCLTWIQIVVVVLFVFAATAEIAAVSLVLDLVALDAMQSSAFASFVF